MTHELFTSRPETDRFIETCQTVSTEAYTISELHSLVQNRMAKLKAGLNDVFRFITTWDYSRPEVINTNSVRAKLRQSRYTDVADIVVAKPVGFLGNLEDYVQELYVQHLPYMAGIRPSVLMKTSRLMAYYLNDLERLSERRVETPSKEYSDEIRASLIEKEARWTVEGNRSSEAAFGDLFVNNNGCVTAMDVVNKLNRRRWAEANPKEIVKEVQRLQQTATALLDAIHRQETTPSKQVMAEIANNLQHAARWVEWFSVMQTRVIDTTTALKHTERTLLRAL